MAIFFKTNPSAKETSSTGPPSQLSWIRLGAAILLLLGLVAGALLSAGKLELQGFHAMMLHSFELMLGAVVGLLTGEASTRA